MGRLQARKLQTMARAAYLQVFLFASLAFSAFAAQEARSDVTAADVLKRVYTECVQHGSLACIKPKLLAFLSSAVKNDQIAITKDMLIVRRNGAPAPSAAYLEAEMEQLPMAEDERREALRALMMDRVEAFIETHDLKIRVPKEIVSGSLLPFVPKFLLEQVPAEVTVPLTNSRGVQERGFVKKVVIPFLLGLKFKATALIPLALALIALKTWKALTLGLLSLVLSGAMVIFKFTKPKVVNYEVYHYPTPHVAPVYEHHPSPPEHPWGRAFDDAADLAYRGYAQ
ncbi:hypothetical protein B566_EDAN008484 [Ephemera danica]|nr:hypothetical protein B566_EDAN008484 [Ephemera danica]